jgi:hypothetical protein
VRGNFAPLPGKRAGGDVALRVIGAGLGRTGTASLKLALERLLGAPCYHMFEVLQHEQHTAMWQSALHEEPIDWDRLLGRYEASVDWPACAFWRELSESNPHALVLLSTRDSAEEWWASMERTIVARLNLPVPPDQPAVARHRAMVLELLDRRFAPAWREPDSAKSAYERHNATVRGSVAPERLLEWRPGDDWEPICAALGLAVPDEPFPHENTTADFRAQMGLGAT